jgi:hypothetical protein
MLPLVQPYASDVSMEVSESVKVHDMDSLVFGFFKALIFLFFLGISGCLFVVAITFWDDFRSIFSKDSNEVAQYLDHR